uniref:Putative secreted protein n=1 Tax=Anopheles marajoara TaxID=58244 RepID=A0A2M4CAZ0_9DIPT
MAGPRTVWQAGFLVVGWLARAVVEPRNQTRCPFGHQFWVECVLRFSFFLFLFYRSERPCVRGINTLGAAVIQLSINGTDFQIS